MGVSYELFWHLNPKKLLPFAEACQRKKQQQSDQMWLMGQYVASALDATVCNAMPFTKRKQKGKYFEKPIRVIPMTEEEKKIEEEKALNQFLSFFNGMDSDANNKCSKGE